MDFLFLLYFYYYNWRSRWRSRPNREEREKNERHAQDGEREWENSRNPWGKEGRGNMLCIRRPRQRAHANSYESRSKRGGAEEEEKDEKNGRQTPIRQNNALIPHADCVPWPSAIFLISVVFSSLTARPRLEKRKCDHKNKHNLRNKTLKKKITPMK